MASYEIPECALKKGKLVKVTYRIYMSIVKASQQRGDNTISILMLARKLFVHEVCQ